MIALILIDDKTAISSCQHVGLSQCKLPILNTIKYLHVSKIKLILMNDVIVVLNAFDLVSQFSIYEPVNKHNFSSF
jgi:hypothetical protein